MRRLILIRHGRTEANERWLYCGSTDLPLSPGGEGELVSYRGKEIYPSLEGCAVYTSGLKRTEQTLSILCGELPHTAEPDLQEMDFGVFEMRAYDELKDEPAYQAWITGDNMANIAPGGESGNLMTARVLAALERIMRRDEAAALFTHGGVIAAIMEHLFPDSGKSRYDWQPKNGLGYIVEFGPDGAALKFKEIGAA